MNKDTHVIHPEQWLYWRKPKRRWLTRIRNLFNGNHNAGDNYSRNTTEVDTTDWIRFFEMLKFTRPQVFATVNSLLEEFVNKHPSPSKYITIDDLEGILKEMYGSVARV